MLKKPNAAENENKKLCIKESVFRLLLEIASYEIIIAPAFAVSYL